MTSRGPRLRLLEGDITGLTVEAMVNPANSLGEMGGGVAGAIRRRGGLEIEAAAMKQAPIPIGTAVLTRAGRLPCRYVIHAPTMVRPAEAADSEKVRKATRAALECADKQGIKQVAFPGMGTGVGGLDPLVAAKVMVEEARAFHAEHLEEVIFVAFGQELKRAFEKALPADSPHA